MNDEIEQLLRNLHLKKIATIIDDELAHADTHQLSYGAFLARLLRAQYHHRQETALAWRITQARLPETWTIESFPFKRQPGVNPKQIRTLAELEFVPKAENIILIGQTGVGKTGLASGLLLKAIQNGVTVQGVEDGDPKVTLDNSPIAKYVGVDEWARQPTEAAWERRFRTDEPMEP